jgi:hypothetical protein
MGRASAMAVSADHLALGDLVQDVLPPSATQLETDRECFVAEVVELEDNGVSLSAVDAGIARKEVDQELGSL